MGNTAAVEIGANGTLTLASGTVTSPSILVDNGGTLGGTGTLNGPLVNNGLVTSGAAQTLTFNGNVTNNGSMAFTGGTTFAFTGIFTNNGVLDFVTGSNTLPAGIVNHGTILVAADAKILDAWQDANGYNVTIQSSSSHGYQLQRSDSLDTPNWQNLGSAQQGIDDLLTLTDNTGTAGAPSYSIGSG